MGRATMESPRTTGRLMMECMPRMALWGGLRMGVPIKEPKVPPLEMVNVPPCMSSMEILPSLPFFANSAIPYITSQLLVPSHEISYSDSSSAPAPSALWELPLRSTYPHSSSSQFHSHRSRCSPPGTPSVPKWLL